MIVHLLTVAVTGVCQNMTELIDLQFWSTHSAKHYSEAM